MSKFQINRAYKPLYTTDKRYILVTGGRGSLKSHSIHDFILRLTYDTQPHGVLFSRYTMTSAETSIIPEYKAHIDRLGVTDHFHITRRDIINKTNGSFIWFRGLKPSSQAQSANLKSLAQVDTWVIEEAEDMIDEAMFDRIDDSIRRKGTQNRVILVMNPTNKDHWAYKRWVKSTSKQIEIDGFRVTVSDHPNVENIHTTYHIGRKYLSQDWLKKAENWRIKAIEGYDNILDKQIEPDEQERAKKYYLNNYLGGWKEQAEGAIFTNWREGEFDTDLPYCYGQDYGFSVDPTTLVKVAVDRKRQLIYLEEAFWSTTGMSTDEIAQANANSIDNVNDLIIADSAEGRLIHELRSKGLNIVPAEKGPGSVRAGITKMLGYEIVVSTKSVNLKQELSNYVWNDKKAGIPIDAFNHGIDPARYAFARLERPAMLIG